MRRNYAGVELVFAPFGVGEGHTIRGVRSAQQFKDSAAIAARIVGMVGAMKWAGDGVDQSVSSPFIVEPHAIGAACRFLVEIRTGHGKVGSELWA